MSKTVSVTNLTDAPGMDASAIDIFNTTIMPGETIQVPEELVTDKLYRMAAPAKAKLAVGELPEWYTRAKGQKELTGEQIGKLIIKGDGAAPVVAKFVPPKAKKK